MIQMSLSCIRIIKKKGRRMSQSILSYNKYNKMCYHYLLQEHSLSSHMIYSFISYTIYQKSPLSIVYCEFSVTFFPILFPVLQV